jgi:hypothetical protein
MVMLIAAYRQCVLSSYSNITILHFAALQFRCDIRFVRVSTPVNWGVLKFSHDRRTKLMQFALLGKHSVVAIVRMRAAQKSKTHKMKYSTKYWKTFFSLMHFVQLENANVVFGNPSEYI